MQYFFCSINPLDKEWSLFEQEKMSVTNYYAHSEMEPGDIVLFHIGKQKKKLVNGVYAIGEVVSDLWRDPEENRLRTNIKLLNEAIYNQPLFTEEEITLFKGKMNGIRKPIRIKENIEILEKKLSTVLEKND